MQNQIPLPPQQPTRYQPTLQDKVIGKRFSRAVIITILFLVLSNGYKILEQIYALFTSKPGEIFNPETLQPTFKGYAIMALIFFVAVLFTSWQ